MARIPHSVSEPMLGKIRYQWWRETLENMRPGSEPSHEIVGAVCETFIGNGVDLTALIPLIDSRARELDDDPFDTLGELVAHVGRVARLGVELAFRLVGRGADYEVSKNEIGKIGAAYGMISHVRRIPVDASRQQLSLPLDLMAKHEIDPHDVFGAIVRPGFSAAVGEILEHAGALYEDASATLNSRAIAPRPILLPAALTPLYLKKLGQPGFDLFRHSSEIPAFRRQLRYLHVGWQKKF